MSRGSTRLTCLLANIAGDILLFTWAKCFWHVYWNSKKLNWWISAIIYNTIKWCSIYQRAVNYKAAREHWKLTCWHKTSYTFVYLFVCNIIKSVQIEVGYKLISFTLMRKSKCPRMKRWRTPQDVCWWDDFMVSISMNCNLMKDSFQTKYW